MPRLIFGCLFVAFWGTLSEAQRVPGRELLDFPVGTVGEAPTLARLAASGLWNPATIVLGEDARLRISAAALHTPSDQGVSSHLLAAAARVPGRRTVGLSIVRASISEIWRTDSTPVTSGSEIPYATTLVSASLAQRRDHLSLGLAARFRHGQMDGQHRSAVGLDGGVVLHGLFGRDLNAGAATFLWRPGESGRERAAVSVAADMRVAGSDSLHQTRLGYSLSASEGQQTEHYGLVSGRYRSWEGRIGVARHTAFAFADWRLRIGLGVHHARYTVAVAREENGAGLGPVYQFALVATID